MKKIIAIALPVLFFAGLAFHSCKDPIAEEFTGDIVGIVSDKTTGEPIPTVNVSLEPGGVSTVTGSDGSYLFAELEIGSYTVSVTKQGYNPDSKVVDVEPGKTTNGDFLIERIPSVVTVDRDVLDFGEGSDVNSLSFNIVNSGYEDLEWKIEYDCDWIREIRDTSGTLAYGKTQAIVVFIDRELLVPGENTTTLVVRSSNGSSDLTVKAVGAEREEVVLNTLEVEDITSSTATFYAKIINAGVPKYTSRGFVYSTSSNPTEATAIEVLTVPVTEDSVFSARVSGLELNKKYYVRAFAKSELGTFYSTNEISFTASGTDPKVTVLDVSGINVQALSAVFNANVESIGDPAYTSRGFVYDTAGNPTIQNMILTAAGSGTGTYSAEAKDLIFNRTYYVRAFVESDAGTFYSDNEVSFALLPSLPEVRVDEVTDISVSTMSAVLNGTVIAEGAPAYTEKGFVYGQMPSPTINDNYKVSQSTDNAAFSTRITNIEGGKEYYVRAYAKVDTMIVYSENQVSFSIETSLPEVSVQDASNINLTTRSAILNGTIINVGEPAYTEKGFVYNLMNNPTLYDSKVIANGDGLGPFSAEIHDLLFDTTYYVRAYAINGGGVVYSSDSITFSTVSTPPSLTVEDVTNIDITKGTAVFNGTITAPGNPEYHEKGFVYGTLTNPTVKDKVIIADGAGTGAFRAQAGDLDINTTYYVRAYAVSNTGTYYSSTQVSFNTIPELPTVSVQKASNINVAERSVILNGTVEDSGNPTYSEKGFVYGFKENPTIYDTRIPVTGSGSGIFSTKLSGLALNQEYFVRSYAINEGGVAYSSSNISFTISVTPAELSVLPVIGIDYKTQSAVLRGSILSVGDPAYTEKGFVYGNSSENPSLSTGKIKVEGTAIGDFSATATDLVLGRSYYVWAYSVNDGQTFYSQAYESFRVAPQPAEVKTYDALNVNMEAGSALLYGEITNMGGPEYTERGFVYNTTGNPTIYDTKLVVEGDGEGLFSIQATNLPTTGDCYIRSYAVNDAGVAYGSQVAISQKIAILYDAGIAVQREDINSSTGTHSNISQQCENSRLSGYSDWRLPTLDELFVIYNQKDSIGGFNISTSQTEYNYWWTSMEASYGYYFINFRNGSADSGGNMRCKGRAVRTLILPPTL